jgi:hypothetical protein
MDVHNIDEFEHNLWFLKVVFVFQLVYQQLYGNTLRTFFSVAPSVWKQVQQLIAPLPRDAILISLQVFDSHASLLHSFDWNILIFQFKS